MRSISDIFRSMRRSGLVTLATLSVSCVAHAFLAAKPRANISNS